jgi:uncharacterized protein
MRSTVIWFIVGILLLLDIYVYQALKVVTGDSPRWRAIIFGAYWTVSIVTLVTLILLPLTDFSNWPKSARLYTFAIIIALFFSKLLASIFLVVDDLRRGATWLVTKLFSNPGIDVSQNEQGITRSVFLSWLGLGVGSALLGTLLVGFANKYRYQVRKVKLAYKNLPSNFRGLKILHISDIHSGSFMDKKAVEAGVQKILKQQADIILFTGDIVNDHAHEMDDYIDIFKKLSAPMGVYSTLGNHDYGEYDLPQGLTYEERRTVVAGNVEKLKKVHSQLGWRLLMNEHVKLDRDGHKIALIGIENWGGKGNFPKYGKMTEAYPGTEEIPFKILMSHDPSHWEGEVRGKYPDIDLMLSGHTHGMQFGVEIPGFRWSPVQYMYKQWAGLYEDEEQKQKLYVNRGFGFIGYPGRVGILPEITVIELT